MEPAIIGACSPDKIRLPLAQKLKTARLAGKSHLRRFRPRVETKPQQRSEDKVRAGGETLRRHELFLFGIRSKCEGAVGAKNWLPEDSTWDAEVGEPFAVMNDFRSGEEDPYSAAITLDQSFSVNDSENEKLAIRKASIRDKDEVKKTTKRSVKKPQRRVTSRDRDRGFSPLQELQRAREKIRRTIRSIL